MHTRLRASRTLARGLEVSQKRCKIVWKLKELTRRHLPKLDHRFMIRWIEILVDDHVETLPAFLDRVEINRLDPRRSNRGRENDSCSTGTRSWVPCCFQRDGKITAQNQPGSTQAPHLFRTLQLQFSARLRVGTAGRVQRVTVKDAFTQ